MKLIKTSPDKDRAKSILRMVSLIEERIKKQHKGKFASLIITDYYEIVKELITAVLLTDGYKTLSHRDLISYLKKKYPEVSEYEISLMNDLRVLRNRVAYEGFFIQHPYLIRNEVSFKKIIQKLKSLAKKKLE